MSFVAAVKGKHPEFQETLTPFNNWLDTLLNATTSISRPSVYLP